MRKITIKLSSKDASTVLKDLGLDTAEIIVEMEDTGSTYKKLSSIPGIEDWEFTKENINSDVPIRRGIEDHPGIEDASILFEALYALKLNHPARSFESLSKEDLDEQIQFISNSETSFNHLAIKVTIERAYKNAEEAKESIMEIFKKEWNQVLTYGTVLGFMYHLYGKK